MNTFVLFRFSRNNQRTERISCNQNKTTKYNVNKKVDDLSHFISNTNRKKAYILLLKTMSI